MLTYLEQESTGILHRWYSLFTRKLNYNESKCQYGRLLIQLVSAAIQASL